MTQPPSQAIKLKLNLMREIPNEKPRVSCLSNDRYVISRAWRQLMSSDKAQSKHYARNTELQKNTRLIHYIKRRNHHVDATPYMIYVQKPNVTRHNIERSSPISAQTQRYLWPSRTTISGRGRFTIYKTTRVTPSFLFSVHSPRTRPPVITRSSLHEETTSTLQPLIHTQAQPATAIKHLRYPHLLRYFQYR